MSDQRILRYQVVLMENPGLTISLSEVLNPPTSCLPPRALSPFTLAEKPWTNGKKSREGLTDDPLTNPDKSGTLMETTLSWMEKEEPEMK